MINLVIEDYVASLKEKDELDVLLPNLLKLKGYTIMSIPKTGERQFGVDLLAKKEDELYLYVIKQGDLTRSSWNNKVNDVRPSMDEIFDVYLPTMIDPNFIGKKKNIVFVTNGHIRDAVRPNWEGYKKNRTTELIQFDEILLFNLVEMVSEFGFNETLFSKEMHSNLRKCLYYLDEPDYKTNYFKLIIEEYIELLSNAVSKNNKEKVYNSLWMFLNLVNSYAFEKGRYRISVEFAEIVLIAIWKHIKDIDAFEKKLETDWLYKMIENYSENNERLVDNLVGFVEYSQGIPSYTNLEHRLLCFDILGKLSVYGLFLCDMEDILIKTKYTSSGITNIIIELLNNNYGFYYPLYDNDGIEISLFFYLLKRKNRKKDLENLLNAYTFHLLAMIGNKKYPVLERRYSLSLDVEFDDVNYEKRYTSSFLWGIIREWSVLTGQKEISKLIIKDNLFKKIDTQNWNCSNVDEDGLYNKLNAVNQGYSTIYNHLEDDDLEKIFNEKEMIKDFSNFTFIKYSFATLGLIISRLHRVPVIPSYWRKEFLE